MVPKMRRLAALHAHVVPAAAAVETALIGGEQVELVPHDQPRQHSDSVGDFPRSERWTCDGHKLAGSRGAGQPLLQDARNHDVTSL